MRFPSVLTLVAPWVLAAPLVAFTDPLASKYVEWSKFNSLPFSPGVFTKALPIDFAATGNPQIALLRDDVLMFGWTPDVHSSAAPIATGINDFCHVGKHHTLPSDVIASVGANGVYVHYMSGHAIVSTVIDGNTSVAGARKIGAGDIDGDGKPDLVVVRSNGLDVRLYHNTGALTFAAGAEMTLTSEARDAWIVQWGASLEPRVVLHGAAGIGVYHADLTSDSVLRTAPPGPAIDAAGVFTLPGGEQGIGWTTQLSAGSSSQKFMTYRQSGSTNWGQVGPVGGEVSYEPGVSSLVLGDTTSDGFPDLVLGATGGPALLYSRNLARSSGGPLSFGVGETSLLPWTVSVSAVANTSFRATPVLADFNADRMMDLFVPVQNVPGQTALLGPLDAQGPNLTGTEPEWPIVDAWSAITAGGGSNYPGAGQLKLELTNQAWTNYSTATHLRVIVWRWPFPCAGGPPDCNDANRPLDTTAVHNYYYRLDTTTHWLPASYGNKLTLPLDGTSGGTWSAYFLELSLVEATIGPSTARVTNAWETFSYGFAHEEKPGGGQVPMTGPVMRMRNLPDAGEEFEVHYPGEDLPPLTMLAAPILGIVIKIPRQPPFAPNVVPVLGVPTEFL